MSRYDEPQYSQWDTLSYQHGWIADEADDAEYALQQTGTITRRQFCALVGKRTGIPTNYRFPSGIATRFEPYPYKHPKEICTIGSAWQRQHAQTLRTLVGAIDCPATRGACLNELNGVREAEGELPECVGKLRAFLKNFGIHIPAPKEETPHQTLEEMDAELARLRAVRAELDARAQQKAQPLPVNPVNIYEDEEDPFAEVAA